MKTVPLPRHFEEISDSFSDYVLWFRTEPNPWGYEAFNDHADQTAGVLGREPLVADDGSRMIWVGPKEMQSAHDAICAVGIGVKIITLYKEATDGQVHDGDRTTTS